MDVLSDVLRMIRLEGALFLQAQFHEPWCVDAPASSALASVLRPGAEDLVICHLVVEGRCWARLHDGEILPLEAGDVLVLPHGDSHLIGSGLQHAPMNIDDVVQLKVPDLSSVRYGGNGDPTTLVCGWFSYEREIPNPLVAALPRIFRSSLGGSPAGSWIEQAIRYAVAEAARGHPGSNVMGAKVAEMLFIEALRRYIDALPASEIGWLAGLRDPQVGRSLALLHAEPARAWTVAALAERVHLSRSALAARFSELVQMPPMHYLKRWRLALAARLLCEGKGNLNRIAAEVGYESEAAFNRAFKREYGVAPGLWRRRVASEADAWLPASRFP